MPMPFTYYQIAATRWSTGRWVWAGGVGCVFPFSPTVQISFSSSEESKPGKARAARSHAFRAYSASAHRRFKPRKLWMGAPSLPARSRRHGEAA